MWQSLLFYYNDTTAIGISTVEKTEAIGLK